MCPALGVPVNGRRLGGDFRDGKTVTFKCDGNYDLLGNTTIQCNGGAWSGDPPKCKGNVLNINPSLGSLLKNINYVLLTIYMPKKKVVIPLLEQVQKLWATGWG